MDNFELGCVFVGLMLVAPELLKIVQLWVKEQEQ